MQNIKNDWLVAIDKIRVSMKLDDILPHPEEDKDLGEFLDAIIPKIETRLSPQDFMDKIKDINVEYGENWLSGCIRSHKAHRVTPCTLNGLLVVYFLLLKRRYSRVVSSWPSVPNELQYAYSDCGVAIQDHYTN